VVHLHGLDFGGDTGRGEGEDPQPRPGVAVGEAVDGRERDQQVTEAAEQLDEEALPPRRPAGAAVLVP